MSDRSVPAFVPAIQTGSPPPLRAPKPAPKKSVAYYAIQEAKALRPGQWFLLPQLTPPGSPPNHKRDSAVVRAINKRAERGKVQAAAALTKLPDGQRVAVVHAEVPGDHTTATKPGRGRAVVVKPTAGGPTP